MSDNTSLQFVAKREEEPGDLVSGYLSATRPLSRISCA